MVCCANIHVLFFWTDKLLYGATQLFLTVTISKLNCVIFVLKASAGVGEGFVCEGRGSSAPAGWRDQCCIVSFVYAHIIHVGEALSDYQAAHCCRAAFFSAQTDFSMETVGFVQLFLYLFSDIINQLKGYSF